MTMLQVQEDTAGVKHYAEFVPGCTAPVRTWQETPWDTENKRKGVIPMSEERKPMPGDAVVYHDERGKPHNALCTTNWGGCINVVFVSSDEKKQDDYGRQIGRESSVCHVSATQVHGRYWRWPEEKANEYNPPVAV